MALKCEKGEASDALEPYFTGLSIGCSTLLQLISAPERTKLLVPSCEVSNNTNSSTAELELMLEIAGGRWMSSYKSRLAVYLVNMWTVQGCCYIM